MPNTYEILSDQAVEQLHQNFMTRIKDKAESWVSSDIENRDETVKKTEATLLMATRLGESLSPDGFKQIIADGEERLDQFYKDYVSKTEKDLWKNQRVDLDKKYAAREEAPLVKKAFAGKERIYIRMHQDENESATQQLVTEFLSTRGYTVKDYKKGYATDQKAKQTFKIGKLLKDSALYERFVNDDIRGSQNKYIVFSKAQADLEMMSTNRAWSSCMASDGIYQYRVPKIVGSKTVVAYLVSENDPEVNNPLARILLKPYDRRDHSLRKSIDQVNEHGVAGASIGHIFKYYSARLFQGELDMQDNTVLLCAGQTYGLKTKMFRKTVKEFSSNNFNKPKNRVYYLDNDVYPDGLASRLRVNMAGSFKPLHW